MNRRVSVAALLLAFGLSGCASNNKDFEKEIWGQQAPESPSDTGWPRQSAPPPPPPPAYAPPPYAPPPPAPAASRQLPAQAAKAGTAPVSSPKPAEPGGTGRTIAPPVVEPAPTVTDPRFAPKPFKPGAAEAEQTAAPQAGYPGAPAAASAPATAATPTAPAAAPEQAAQALPAEPAGAPSDRATFTFMTGSFAHREKASELMNALESRGFSTRIDQGKLNNKTFFKVYAVKDGNRAELEGELFAAGVTEPHLTEDRPLDRSGAPKAGSAAAAKTTPAAAGTPKAPSPKPSGNIPPPIVEPAPPLPDGYVPPPPKAGGS